MSVPKKREQNDDRDRHAEKPKKNASAHFTSPAQEYGMETEITFGSSGDCPLLLILLARLSAGPNEVVPFESSSTQAGNSN
jgi:hypothetical protein